MSDISKIIINTNEEYDLKDATARTGLSGKADNTPTFSEASTRANLSGSGETMPTILGKIKKYFSDLKDLAFIAKDGTSSTKFLRGDGTWQSLSIPTKVSDLTNDSGFVTTDEKVTGQIQNPSSETTYHLTFITGTANQKPYYNNGIKYVTKEGTASVNGYGQLQLGNGTQSGTAGNKRGSLLIFSEKNGFVTLRATSSSTASRDIYFPDKAGTVALTSDIPTVGTIATIDLGTEDSRFLREDGTWQDTTWDGGTIENNIIPASGDISLGSSSNPFDVVYTATLETDWINFKSTDYPYTAVLNSPSTLTSSVNIYLPNASGTLVTDSYLNSNIPAYSRFMRAQVEKSLAANGDVNISLTDIAYAANLDYTKIKCVFPEGVRVKTTWNCKPCLFYNTNTNQWGVHNNGSTADSIYVSFLLFYVD